MYRILAAIDEDTERARRSAEAIADFPGDPDELEVTILNVFEEFEVTDGEGTVRSEDVFDESALPESVSVAKQLLEERGVSVSTRREHGDPAETIVAVADEIDADTIAITGRKRSAVGKVLFGSVTQSVLLSANRPVHVVILGEA